MQQRFNKQGFTLAEMLIALTLVGVLAGVLAPSLMGHRQKCVGCGNAGFGLFG
jgi:prepilin-type N-terminal cleavage/methylation domain-containing protein